MNKNPLNLPAADHQTNISVYTKKEVDLADIPKAEILYNETLALLGELISLEKKVVADGDTYLKKYKSYFDRQQVCLSASNLAHYLSFRRNDLRPLQTKLA